MFDTSNYNDEVNFQVDFGVGPSFSYFEATAGDKNVTLNFTFYTGNASVIYSNFSACGSVQNSSKFGNYFVCSCKLTA